MLVRLVLAFFGAGVFLATSAHVLFFTDFLIDLAGVFADFFAVFGVLAAVKIKVQKPSSYRVFFQIEHMCSKVNVILRVYSKEVIPTNEL